VRFPHDPTHPHCVTQDALLALVEALDRLDDWHYQATRRETPCGPCLRELDITLGGRLTAHVTLEPDGGIVLLEYDHLRERWEMIT
jgi:hypothetical protein